MLAVQSGFRMRAANAETAVSGVRSLLLVEKTLAILAALVHQTWRYPLVGLFAHDGGVRRERLEGERTVQVPPLGRAEGSMSVLWECVIGHHRGLSTSPRTRSRVPRKPLSVPRL
jgi:hypothetical protein